MHAGEITEVPLYRKVHDKLLTRIFEGEWTVGKRLPNEFEIALELGVSIGTARKALTMLQAQGLISRQKGKGTYLKNLNGAFDKYECIRRGDGGDLRARVSLVSFECGVATFEERGKLKLGEEPIVRTKRMHETKNNAPFQFEISLVPAAAFPDLQLDERLRSLTTIELAKRHNIALGKMTESVKLAGAPEVSAMLSVSSDVKLLCLDRILHRFSGEILEWRRAWCNVDEDIAYFSGIEQAA